MFEILKKETPLVSPRMLNDIPTPTNHKNEEIPTQLDAGTHEVFDCTTILNQQRREMFDDVRDLISTQIDANKSNLIDIYSFIPRIEYALSNPTNGRRRGVRIGATSMPNSARKYKSGNQSGNSTNKVHNYGGDDDIFSRKNDSLYGLT